MISGPNPHPNRLIPASASGLPSKVAKANDEAREAIAAYELARAEEEAAKQAADEAPRLDERADKQALETGKDMSEPTAPRLRQELADATRRAQAAAGVGREAENRLAAVIAEEGVAEWRDALRAAEEETLQRIVAITDELREAFDDLERDRTVAEAIDRFNGHRAMLDFSSRHGRRWDRAAVQEEQRAQSTGGSRHTVPRHPEHLVPAIRLCAEGVSPENLQIRSPRQRAAAARSGG